MQINELYQRFLAHPHIQTDTRKLSPGDLFFALKGPNFNGNQFVQAALDAGAAYAIADEETGIGDSRVIMVDDVLKTLQDLAKHHRLQFSHIPFIAITGSNGKTTTKELVHEVLSTTYRTYTTAGNLNNHIGIPLTILKIKNDAEIAVIEMGANHLKEIEQYCTYTLPTHGLITNCGKAHLEGFGSIEGVRKGKGELYDHLRANNGTAFVMWDYDYLQTMSRGIPHIITYGTAGTDITGQAANSSEFLQVHIEKPGTIGDIYTQLVGDYNLPNVLAAVAVGNCFNIPAEKIKAALEQYAPSNSRSQLIEKNGNRIILDAYNANPSSMKAAIENFAKMPGNSKVLMLGGMMELGDDSFMEHRAIVDLVRQYEWAAVVFAGGDFRRVDHPYQYFDTAAAARDWFREQHFTNSNILIKGSRSMKMETILE